jgi:hypothetical protein
MVALYFVFYNFGGVHQALRVTPVILAAIADQTCSIEESSVCSKIALAMPDANSQNASRFQTTCRRLLSEGDWLRPASVLDIADNAFASRFATQRRELAVPRCLLAGSLRVSTVERRAGPQACANVKTETDPPLEG